MTTRPLLSFALLLVIFSVPCAFAQPCTPDPTVIDFECNPEDNAPFADGEFVSDQYNVAPWFVSFSLIGAPLTTGPVIAEVGLPQTAFQGPNLVNACYPTKTNADMPRGQAATEVGCLFLTDDGINQRLAFGLLITYQNGVRRAAGILLDVEPCCEEWIITALDLNSQTLATDHVSWEDTDTGNGYATFWSFNLDALPNPPANDIRFIKLEYTGDVQHPVGLAFDSFTPTTLPPVPTSTETWGRVKSTYR